MITYNRTVPTPDYKTELTPEEKQRFGYLVHVYRKQGYALADAQNKAYFEVLAQSIPFDLEGR